MGAPTSEADVGSLALLEREAELVRLRELIAGAAEGHGAAAAVVGPAGIGKTSLLTAAQGLSRQLGMSDLRARGGELERDLPYGVVRQLYELALHRLTDDERRSTLEGAAALAAPVVGVGDGKSPGADSTFAVTHGLYWLTMNLAQRGALLITVDDVHWADAASLRFLAYLQRRIEDLPILVLTAARPGAETPDAELLQAITGDPGVHGLAIAPLSEAAVGTLLQASLGRTPESSVVRGCYEATSGNPFLCALLASVIAEEEAHEDAALGSQVTEATAHSLSTIIVGRLGRLSAAAASLARAVAILGTDVEFRHAASLAELDTREAAAAADALAAREIVRAGAGIDFVHPLVRAAVRDSVPATERALLHARAAKLLAREGAPPERIAMHLLAAEPAAQPWVTESLRAAARLVAARGDPQTAVSYLRRALREPPEPPARAAVLHELGVAEIHAGQSEPAARSLDEAHRLAEGATQRAHIARDLALALTTPGRYQEAVAVLVGTLEDAAGLERDLTLQLEAELHQSGMMEPSLYRAVNARLDRLDHEVAGNTPGERSLLAALATEGLLRTLDAAQVRERARLAFERGLLDDHLPYSSLWGNAAFPLILADGFTEARSVSARAIQDARQRGSPVNSTRAHAVSAMLHLREGAVRDAESDALIAVELGLQAGFAVSLISLGALIESRVERGELATAEAALMEAGMGGDIADRFRDNWVLYARGRLRQAQGRTDEAIVDFEELGDRGERGWRPWNPALFAYRSALALTLLSSGERERAQDLANEELALSRQWGAARAIGMSLRTLGLVANGDRGIALLRESVATLDGSGAQLEHARSLVELGAAIRRTGKRSEAREPLYAGMELAHQCGAAPLAERAHEELLATGARPRRVMRSGVDALTPSERRVARMAAEGMTNREIAQALFVTLRTVQVHLTHTYQKLNISSREQLPNALAALSVPSGHATSIAPS